MQYSLWLPGSLARPPERTSAAGAIRSRRKSGSHGIRQCQSAVKEKIDVKKKNLTQLFVAKDKAILSEMKKKTKKNIKRTNHLLTFWDTIRKVSMSSSFSTSVILMLWPWTLRVDSPSLTSSYKQQENVENNIIKKNELNRTAKLHSSNNGYADTAWH